VDRCGIRLADLVHIPRFKERLEFVVEYTNTLLTDFFKEDPISFDDIFKSYSALGQQIAPFLGDVPRYLNEAAKRGEKILFEGAQGTLLDIDAGTYPYVTSSNTGAGGACTGSGFPPHRIDGCLGIVKAYTTRVGGGPFPTEVTGELADQIRNAGPVGEFGATTGRPRRVGWLDLPLLRRSVMLNGIEQLAVTRLDILGEFDRIPVCVGYRINNQETHLAPEDLSDLESCEPVFAELPGWKCDISKARTWGDLPANAQAYLEFMEKETGARIALVSIGPNREETIYRVPEIFSAF
jgi:adenylosuccinate synthase